MASFLYSTFRCFFCSTTYLRIATATTEHPVSTRLSLFFVSFFLSPSLSLLVLLIVMSNFTPLDPPPQHHYGRRAGGKESIFIIPRHIISLYYTLVLSSTPRPNIHPSTHPSIQSLSLSPLKHDIYYRPKVLLPTLTQMILLTNWLHQYFQWFHLPFGQQTKFRTKEHKMFKTCIQMWCHL